MASRYPDENWETESNNTTDSELSEVSDSNNACGKYTRIFSVLTVFLIIQSEVEPKGW